MIAMRYSYKDVICNTPLALSSVCTQKPRTLSNAQGFIHSCATGDHRGFAPTNHNYCRGRPPCLNHSGAGSVPSHLSASLQQKPLCQHDHFSASDSLFWSALCFIFSFNACISASTCCFRSSLSNSSCNCASSPPIISA